MDVQTRRRFLIGSGVVGAGGIAAGATWRSWWDLVERGASDPRPVGAGVLVLLTLYGGNDGLDTVVPVSDPAYYDARGTLAVAECDGFDLGDGLAFHPALGGLHGLWQDGLVAVVRGVGYPKPDRSHFRSMDIWQTASPEEPVDTGWLGRWLDATGADPLRAVSLGAVLPPLLAGATTAGSALQVGRLEIPAAAAGRELGRIAAPQPGEPALQAAVAAGYRDLATVVDTLGPAVNAPATTPGSGGEEAEPGAPAADESKAADGSAGGQGGLAAQLDIVARCIEGRAPTRVYAVSLGGFDTHAGERETHAALLREVDEAVTAFLGRVASAPGGEDVVIMAYSEFGRRVKANGGDGTDHGTAGVVLLAGSPVAGGFHGEQPSLTKLEDGDLLVTTDFRAVYGELLATALGTDPARVLGHVPQPLGVLK